MKKILLFCVSFLLFVSTQAQVITAYQKYSGTAIYQGKQLLCLRRFLKNGQPCFLAVEVNTLKTQVYPANVLSVITNGNFNNSPYIKALQQAGRQSYTLQDAGIIHGYPKEKGITLTIDLCPSHKPLDRVVFTSLIQEFAKIEKPVPLALSVSGRFMLTHQDDLNWLKKLEKVGDLDITWINHTYNHHYNPNIPLPENFLLAPGTDLNFEVLGTEIAMLQNGLTPSVFFRFPGLVSDNRIVEKIIGYGLIPIGSDAWLAKGQAANAGSIVLIHGNGNEPAGVTDFFKLLRQNRKAVTQHQWLLYDLRETVDDEFQR